jgi:uncharacterized protein YaaN involved in tellurite resistance
MDQPQPAFKSVTSDVLPVSALDDVELDRLAAEIDLDDSHSVLQFGSRAQEDLTRISDEMLERVRSKDLGGAGDALNDMVLALRGFDLGKHAETGRPGWLDRLLGRANNTVRLLQRYEQARDQIDSMMDRLDAQQTLLLIDIETLDRLYQANLDYFHALERYIAAGERRLVRIDGEELPVLQARVDADEQAIVAQQLRDRRMTRDLLDRRLHDLRLTRQVTMQSLPSIRMVQDNDRSLVARIRSTLVNTVPLWRQQLAQALVVGRARETASTLDAANDLTNELLRSNAESLRDANREVRRQAERAVVDIDAVSEANRMLIESIEEGLRIADEGRSARARADRELHALEHQLRESLAAAGARGAALPAADPQRAA